VSLKSYVKNQYTYKLSSGLLIANVKFDVLNYKQLIDFYMFKC